MADYAKWDKLEVSDDEGQEEKRDRQLRERTRNIVSGENSQELLDRKQQLDQWLRRQLQTMSFPSSTVPELDEQAPPRRLSDEERSTLAMFAVLSDVGESGDNLSRHRELVELSRKNQWLEEAGTMETLRRVHRRAIESASEMGISQQTKESLAILMSALNTLAAPKCAQVSGGNRLFDLFSIIGDPKTQEAWDLREAYARKLFARDALLGFNLDDTVPSLRGSTQGAAEEASGSIFLTVAWACGLIFLALLIASAAYITGYGTSLALPLRAFFGGVSSGQTSPTSEL